MDKAFILVNKMLIRVDPELKIIKIANTHYENEDVFKYNDYLKDIDYIKNKIMDFFENKFSKENVFILLYFEKENVDILYYKLFNLLFLEILEKKLSWNLFVSNRKDSHTAFENMKFFIHISCDPCFIVLPNINLFDEYFNSSIGSGIIFDIVDIYNMIIDIVNGSENRVAITKNCERELNKILNKNTQVIDSNIKTKYSDLIIANDIATSIREGIKDLCVLFFMGHGNHRKKCIDFCSIYPDSISEEDVLSLFGTVNKKYIDIISCETSAQNIGEKLVTSPFFQAIRDNDDVIANITFIEIDILKSFAIFAVKVRNQLYRYNIAHEITKYNQMSTQLDALTASINFLLEKI